MPFVANSPVWEVIFYGNSKYQVDSFGTWKKSFCFIKCNNCPHLLFHHMWMLQSININKDAAKLKLKLPFLLAGHASLRLSFDLRGSVISSWVFPLSFLGVPTHTDKPAIWVGIFVTWTPVVCELNWNHKLIPYHLSHNLHYLIQFPTATGNKNKVSCDYEVMSVHFKYVSWAI